MTRQHFEAIAETLRRVRPDSAENTSKADAGERRQWAQTVRAFAVTLARFNAGFQPARFFKACGLED